MLTCHPFSDTGCAVNAENLTCGYGGEPILRNVTFAVRPGEIFYIVGGSGCGKSTLLKHLIGLRTPTEGTVRFFGDDFTRADPARRREMLRRFGVLYQSSALWSSLTVAENVALPLQEYSSLTDRERDELVALKLAQVGLTGYEHHYPAEISGGMKKRAGLARALALDPAIVFFDEPSAGLDPVTSRKLDELMLQIRETLGTTLIVVSHELDSIFGVADRLIMLAREEKGIIAEGHPAILARESDDPRVREFLQRADAENRPKSSIRP